MKLSELVKEEEKKGCQCQVPYPLLAVAKRYVRLRNELKGYENRNISLIHVRPLLKKMPPYGEDK